MALKPLDVFKLLPKTNCKECGFPTCLAFAMQMAMGKVELAKCTYVAEDAKAKLAEETAPPIKTVTIGKDGGKINIGGETVLYRHEKTFYNPPAIGILITEEMSDGERDLILNKIPEYERVGMILRSELIAIEDGGTDRFFENVKKSASSGKALLLMSGSPERIRESALLCQELRPILFGADNNNYKEFSAIAKELKLPLAAKGKTLDELADLSKKLSENGVEDIILYPESDNLQHLYQNLVYIRRASIMKKTRELGYPVLAMPASFSGGYMKEALYASTAIARYASMVVLNSHEGEALFPLLLERLNIFTDPQRPMTTSEGIYEIGSPNRQSPVIVTTNFSLTYFIVSGEIETSRVASYLLIQDTEGLSVLTAWAADKFNAETIAALVKKTGIEDKATGKTLVIPGVTAQILGELEDELPGWKIMLGPREASHLPAFLKNINQ